MWSLSPLFASSFPNTQPLPLVVLGPRENQKNTALHPCRRTCRKVSQSVAFWGFLRSRNRAFSLFSRLEGPFYTNACDKADVALATAVPLACPTTRNSSLTSNADPPRTPGGRVKT